MSAFVIYSRLPVIYLALGLLLIFLLASMLMCRYGRHCMQMLLSTIHVHVGCCMLIDIT